MNNQSLARRSKEDDILQFKFDKHRIPCIIMGQKNCVIESFVNVYILYLFQWRMKTVLCLFVKVHSLVWQCHLLPHPTNTTDLLVTNINWHLCILRTKSERDDKPCVFSSKKDNALCLSCVKKCLWHMLELSLQLLKCCNEKLSLSYWPWNTPNAAHASLEHARMCGKSRVPQLQEINYVSGLLFIVFNFNV